MVGLLVVVLGVRVDIKLSDAVTDGAVFKRFSSNSGLLLLVARRCGRSYKSAPSTFCVDVLCDVLNESLRRTCLSHMPRYLLTVSYWENRLSCGRIKTCDLCGYRRRWFVFN